MDRTPGYGKAIASTVGAAVAASLLVLLAGVLLFGSDLAQWAELEGRAVGVAGTIAGIAGGVVGLRLGGRAGRQPVS